MTDFIAQFHFLRPWWLIVLPISWLLVYWLAQHQQRQQNAWRDVMDPRLLAALSVRNNSAKNHSTWIPWLLAGIATLSLIALAGPTGQQRELPLSKSQLARVVVLDLSRSMLANDSQPSRLEQAKRKARDLFQQLNEGETGLVVFAGEAFAISPLTNDSNTLAAQLPALSPNVVPVQGGRVIHALQEASKLLRNAGHKKGDIIFLSDSTPSANAYDFAEKLAAEGYRSHVIAFGSEQGAPIPAANGGYIKDSSGNIVLPKLDVSALKRFALTGAGHFSTAQFDDADIRPFLDQKPDLNPEQQAALEANLEAAKNSWIDAGIWLLPLIALLAATLFRKGWFAPAVLLCLISAPHDASWANDQKNSQEGSNNKQSLWQNQAQYGHELYKQQQYKKALDVLEDPQWKASAAYQDGQYHQAAELYAQDTSANGHYNRGNALAKAGEYEPAIAAYQQALEINPEHAAAQKNKQIVEDYLEQQQDSQDQSQEQNGSDGADSEESNSQSSENSEQNQSQPSSQSQSSESDGQQADSQNPNTEPESANKDKAQAQASDEATEEKAPEQTEATAAEKSDDKAEGQLSAAKLAQQQAEKQARQQWLQRIPDDPAALWRNKFAHEYDQRERRGETTQNYSDEAW